MIAAFLDHTHIILIIKIYILQLMMRIRKDKIGTVIQIQKNSNPFSLLSKNKKDGEDQ